MADVINLGQRVSSVDVSPQFQPYSKVIIHIDDDTVVEVGNNTGRVLEFDNPFGSKEMAQNILNKLSGFQYQPYQADGALLDPAAEIGDAISTATSYGGMYTRSRKFGRLMKADVSAPHDEEINHEFKYESPQERQFTRVTGEIKASIIITNNLIQSEVVNRKSENEELSSRLTQTAESLTTEVLRATAAEGTLSSRITQNADSITAEVDRARTEEGTLSSKITQNAESITAEVTRATKAEGNLQSTLSVQASEIAAKVNASGGVNESGSFSWKLNSSGHRWYANGSKTPVMSITASGLTVNGTVNATAGKIGGFKIGASALQYNDLEYGDTEKSKGIYIGTSGIQLGKSFKVSTSGAVTATNISAENMKLTGTLTIGDSTISADDLRIGAQKSYDNYDSWNGTTSTVDNNGSYWTGGAGGGYAYSAAASSSSSSYPSGFSCGVLWAKVGINVAGTGASWKHVVINGVAINYLGY